MGRYRIRSRRSDHAGRRGLSDSSDSSLRISGTSPAASIGGPLEQNKLFYFFSFDQQKRDFPGAAVPSNANAFFAPLSAAELATLAGRGVNTTAGNDGLAFMQSLTGVVARTGDQTLALPEDRLADQQRSRGRGELQSPALGARRPACRPPPPWFRGVDNWGDDGVNGGLGYRPFTSVLGPPSHERSALPVGPRLRIPDGASRRSPASRSCPAPRGHRMWNITGTVAFEFGKPNFLERRSYPDERRVQIAGHRDAGCGTRI